jgi:hypothetical protein
MLWDAEFVGELKDAVQKIVDFLTKILGGIFGFIAEEEGWTETTEDATV